MRLSEFLAAVFLAACILVPLFPLLVGSVTP